MVTNYDGEAIQIPSSLPMLPVRDIVVFPYMILPLFVGRENSIRAVEEALSRTDRLIFLASQKDLADEKPDTNGIYSLGTIAMIMRMRKLPDGRVKILCQGLTKARIQDYSQTESYYEVRVQAVEEPPITITSATEALMRNIQEHLEKLISLGKVLSPDILMVLQDIHDPGRLADLVGSNLGLKVQEAQDLLETLDPHERLKKVEDILVRELDIMSIQAKIKVQAKDEMAKSQKEYFLREQMRAIKSELGDNNDPKAEESRELREKLEAAKLPEEAYKEAYKQLSRLERMHPDSSEASIIRTYLDWIVDLPWSKATKDNLDIREAKKILDEDHYDLEKIKERILEHLAVTKLKNKIRGPIICLHGPPGVGKTSLGKSIARCLGRSFIRISLGGVKDEAEVRGHRRTYVGAMPGKIITGLKQAGSNNPVFMLDEIDKLGADFRGDPSSALLEVLDPEQNFSFRDHYLNLSFDLSNVMFVCTANVVENIPQALRDRMEIIHIPGYLQEEKIKIARQYIVRKQMEENGISSKDLEFNDEGLRTIVENYTREAGLRNLERLVGTICRKTARAVAEGTSHKVLSDREQVIKWLGTPPFLGPSDHTTDEVGVSTGLAWTQFGGEVLYIESTMVKGKGGLMLTGQLGDVMKESAQTALTYIRAHSEELGIEDSIFQNYDFHIHVPAGATPKDGPSAGIALATSLVSLFTGNPVNWDVAMTGEITLTGKVLPIGGLREKALAALRYGIKTVIIPDRNAKDLDDIPAEYRERINFVAVKSLEEVLNIALKDKFVWTKTRAGSGKQVASGGAKGKKKLAETAA